MANERDYQPSLLWSRFHSWCAREHGVTEINRPALYIYVKNKPGAYYLHGPRLYWDENLADGHFANCDQDDLWKNRYVLGEAVATGLGKQGRESEVVALDFDSLLGIITPGPVTVLAEAQREYRPSGMGGRFVPTSELGRIAFALMAGESQGEIARQMGIPQPRVHEAINGKNVTVALQMIRHLSGAQVEGPLWFVPEKVDEEAMHRSLGPYPDEDE